MKKTALIFEEINFFGFIHTTPNISYTLESARKRGILKTLDEFPETKPVYNSDQLYTYSDNRYGLFLNEDGYIEKSAKTPNGILFE